MPVSVLLMILVHPLNSVIVHDTDLVYQLDLRAKYLCRLCVIWRRDIRSMPEHHYGDEWGPSDEDLQVALEVEFNANWMEEDNIPDGDQDDSDGSENADCQDVEDQLDDELIDSMEALAFADEYRIMEEERLLYLDTSDISTYTTPTGSPRKRGREF